MTGQIRTTEELADRLRSDIRRLMEIREFWHQERAQLKGTLDSLLERGDVNWPARRSAPIGELVACMMRDIEKGYASVGDAEVGLSDALRRVPDLEWHVRKGTGSKRIV